MPEGAPEGVRLPAATTGRPRLHDLEVLNTIHRISDSSGLSLHERLSAIVKVVAFHLNSDACSVYLEDGEGGRGLVLSATHGLNPGAVGRVSLATGEGVTGWVGREQTPLPVADTANDTRFKGVSEMGDEAFRAILAAPIRLDQRLIGVINVQSREAGEYAPNQVRLLETIGMHLGGIIRSAQLYEDTRKQLRQLRVINGIGQALVSTLHLDPLLEMVLEKSLELTQTRGGILRLWDEDLQQLVVQTTVGDALPDEALRPLFLGEGIPGVTALKQKSYRYNKGSGQLEAHLPPEGVRNHYLCAPVLYQGRAIGTISVFDRVSEVGTPANLTTDDEALLRALANQVAVAIRNAQVCDELTGTVDELQGARELLVQTETLAAIGRMAEGMARELNAALIPIEGQVHRILEEDALSPSARASVIDILDRAGHLEEFVNEVVELARSGRVATEPHQVSNAVGAAVERSRHRIEGGQFTLEARFNAEMLIPLDPEKLIRAVTCLLDNALDAMPAGGTVRVSTEACLFPASGESVEGVRISVWNSGTGIPDGALPHLFTPFFSTREGGRGLSLAIAYRIARAHGGILLAHNPPEGGADFSIYLPVTSRPPLGLR